MIAFGNLQWWDQCAIDASRGKQTPVQRLRHENLLWNKNSPARKLSQGLLYPIELLLSQSWHGNRNVIETGSAAHSVFTSIRWLRSDGPCSFDLSRPEHETQHTGSCPSSLRWDCLNV